tara:strand:+ start:106 stop:231 length:126 start_codon:yes stop_codon:yes gene_type:complete
MLYEEMAYLSTILIELTGKNNKKERNKKYSQLNVPKLKVIK